jgi:uncharacterized protein (TIGR02996 family)
LAALLAESDNAATRLSYTAWFEERNDPRGEYLRLLTGLDELTNPDGGGLTRQRLRELRGQIASDWADKVDRTLLATVGLNFCKMCGDGWAWAKGRAAGYCLRFYPDGIVFSTCSAGTPAEIWLGLTMENLPSDIRWPAYREGLKVPRNAIDQRCAGGATPL